MGLSSYLPSSYLTLSLPRTLHDLLPSSSVTTQIQAFFLPLLTLAIGSDSACLSPNLGTLNHLTLLLYSGTHMQTRLHADHCIHYLHIQTPSHPLSLLVHQHLPKLVT